MKNKNTFILILLIIIFIVAGFVVKKSDTNNDRAGSSNPLSYEPYSVTITGTYICLPHVQNDGPQTMECALGLKALDGKYYSLDLNSSSSSPIMSLSTNTKLTVTGTVTPVERLSTDYWKKYPIVGIISVNDYMVLD
jgi:hypothetical protein